MLLETHDPELAAIMRRERARQRDGVELIPSENYVSAAVLEAMGSILTNKYSEGYPGRRYYGGNEHIDEVERLAQNRARTLFGVPHANVQPYSGSPANLAVYLATCEPGDVIMGQNLPDGGHLTHGWKVSATGTYYKSVPYHVRPDGYIDFDDVWRLAREHRPRLIWCGATAYVREFPFEEFANVADEVGAYFAADIAHVAGLVAGGAHPSPVPHAHIITTTTHKTLRGPRGAMILVSDRGVARDRELPEKIDRAIFPGLQGGPHDHTTAAIAVALGEAALPEFKVYATQIVANAKAFAAALLGGGF
ncbi:MAG: serine hydroxymethyltransferase, partial [bacterium]